MICPRAGLVSDFRAFASGMQETVRRPAGRARVPDPVFVGRLIPVPVHNLAVVISRDSRRGAFRLMISPLFYGGKFPAAIGAAEIVGGWIYCGHSSFRGSAALLVRVLLPRIRCLLPAGGLQIAFLFMRLNRLIDDLPLSLREIRLFTLAGIFRFHWLHTRTEAPRLPLCASPPWAAPTLSETLRPWHVFPTGANCCLSP